MTTSGVLAGDSQTTGSPTTGSPAAANFVAAPAFGRKSTDLLRFSAKNLRKSKQGLRRSK